MRNENKVALVTGAASGIGLAAAHALKRAGFVVYASARRAEALEELQQQGFYTVKLDVTDDNSMRKAVALRAGAARRGRCAGQQRWLRSKRPARGTRVG